jgi:hypothetical protein
MFHRPLDPFFDPEILEKWSEASTGAAVSMPGPMPAALGHIRRVGEPSALFSFARAAAERI